MKAFTHSKWIPLTKTSLGWKKACFPFCVCHSRALLFENTLCQKGMCKNIKIELPYDCAIALLGIDPDKNMIQKDTCTPRFTAALLTIAKTWEHLNVPWQRMAKDVVHVCRGILLNHRKEWNKVICRNMDGPRDCHTEWSQEEEILYNIPYMWNLNINNTDALTKEKEMHRLREWTYSCQRKG